VSDALVFNLDADCSSTSRFSGASLKVASSGFMKTHSIGQGLAEEDSKSLEHSAKTKHKMDTCLH
jgi:hypothetical protein